MKLTREQLFYIYCALPEPKPTHYNDREAYEEDLKDFKQIMQKVKKEVA